MGGGLVDPGVGGAELDSAGDPEPAVAIEEVRRPAGQHALARVVHAGLVVWGARHRRSAVGDEGLGHGGSVETHREARVGAPGVEGHRGLFDVGPLLGEVDRPGPVDLLAEVEPGEGRAGDAAGGHARQGVPRQPAVEAAGVGHEIGAPGEEGVPAGLERLGLRLGQHVEGRGRRPLADDVLDARDPEWEARVDAAIDDVGVAAHGDALVRPDRVEGGGHRGVRMGPHLHPSGPSAPSACRAAAPRRGWACRPRSRRRAGRACQAPACRPAARTARRENPCRSPPAGCRSRARRGRAIAPTCPGRSEDRSGSGRSRHPRSCCGCPSRRRRFS